MEQAFDAIVIGFGKGGKTLAGVLASQGQKVAMVEQSQQMYGGTCINVGCIPTKSLVHSAALSAAQGGDFAVRAKRFAHAIRKKTELTDLLRAKNLDKLQSNPNCTVITGTASFLDAQHILVQTAEGNRVLTGQRIFINTGASAFLPPIPGLSDSKFAYTSAALLEQAVLPRELVIIGGGYIGMEFASIYTDFGAHVTVIQDGDVFLPREDPEIAQAVLDTLTRRGVTVLRSTQTLSIEDTETMAMLKIKDESGTRELAADAVLVATGRRPQVDSLHLENAGVALTKRGAVQTDQHLRTTVANIWAMGDVVGGLQFTYISLDDSRIVLSDLQGDGSRTTDMRGEIPYSVFLAPPFSRIGLSEQEARAQGYQVRIFALTAAAIPKARVLGQTDGMLKAVVDRKNNRILGAHLFCAESHEMINLMKIAMDAGLSYFSLRDAIYTHPTMSEALNDLFADANERQE